MSMVADIEQRYQQLQDAKGTIRRLEGELERERSKYDFLYPEGLPARLHIERDLMRMGTRVGLRLRSPEVSMLVDDRTLHLHRDAPERVWMHITDDLARKFNKAIINAVAAGVRMPQYDARVDFRLGGGIDDVQRR